MEVYSYGWSMHICLGKGLVPSDNKQLHYLYIYFYEPTTITFYDKASLGIYKFVPCLTYPGGAEPIMVRCCQETCFAVSQTGVSHHTVHSRTLLDWPEVGVWHSLVGIMYHHVINVHLKHAYTTLRPQANRDHSGYGLSQWQATLHWNDNLVTVVSQQRK